MRENLRLRLSEGWASTGDRLQGGQHLKMASEPKKRKIEPVGRASSSASAREDKSAASLSSLPAAVADKDHGVHLQAMRLAVAEAKRDHWLGSFKSFASPFGNFIVPVVPTRADFSRAENN
ncbi:unnamed protein product [Spirodela intermedia]|uniref:Uncharacterized protein n=1 Tax=Spirodela intermedia TaxID=51605 RepID=A0A7I8J7L7_SPIIN|nr:unnamed protein product [Spirodela intermedia]CAA6666061.1 unnamed protein product [Spirodela intermedia]